jgi:hypothetical protein
MGVYIRFGILDREDPSDPTSKPIILWPAWRDPAPDSSSPPVILRNRPMHSLMGHAWSTWQRQRGVPPIFVVPPDRPMRSLSASSWSTWQRQRGVPAILTHCGVPAKVDTFFCAPIDDQLLILLAELRSDARRWAWLPGRTYHTERAEWLLRWSVRAREAFGAQARIGFS